MLIKQPGKSSIELILKTLLISSNKPINIYFYNVIILSLIFISDKMKVGLIFPCTEVARTVSMRLLETNCDVEFFCPEKLDLDICSNIVYELNIIGTEQNELRGSESSFSVPKDSDLGDCDIISKDRSGKIVNIYLQDVQVNDHITSSIGLTSDQSLFNIVYCK